MVEANELLMEADLRASLIALDPTVVRMRFDGFPADLSNIADHVYYTWNGPRVLERVYEYTKPPTDWVNGLNIFSEAKLSIYGDYPSEELDRLTRLHFTENSEFNRSLTDGYVYIGEKSTGVITRQNVYDIALGANAKEHGRGLQKMTTAAAGAQKNVATGHRRALLLLENYDGPEADEAREKLDASASQFGNLAMGAVRKFLALGSGSDE